MAEADAGRMHKFPIEGGGLETIGVKYLGQHESVTFLTDDKFLYSSEGTSDLYMVQKGAK